MKTIFTIMSFVIATNCFAQINTLYVEPNETDSAYKKTDTNYVCNKNSNYIVRNTKTNLNKLLLFLGGTKSNPKEYKIFSDFAGKLGYDVINLSYPNSVLAAGLSCSSDSLAFNKYRQAICYGTPGSSDVKVDTLNSIYTRTVKLINYLKETYPEQNWKQYLSSPTTLDWSKITVGGHSQGGGHACYFAKFNKVERVLMFSSPNDYSYSFSKSANWLSTPGVTSMNKHFAYLSLFDAKIPFYNQMMNIQSLGLYPSYGAINVDTSSEPYGFSHCLYTAQLTRLPLKLTSKIYHLLTIILGSSINKSVWTYMLTSDVSIVFNECQKQSE
jgi:hypothetical protein